MEKLLQLWSSFPLALQSLMLYSLLEPQNHPINMSEKYFKLVINIIYQRHTHQLNRNKDIPWMQQETNKIKTFITETVTRQTQRKHSSDIKVKDQYILQLEHLQIQQLPTLRIPFCSVLLLCYSRSKESEEPLFQVAPSGTSLNVGWLSSPYLCYQPRSTI